MIVKVEKAEEASILEYCCAVFGLQCHMFTMENNPSLMQVEILHSNGGDLDAETSWLLCKSVGVKLERMSTR